MRRIYRESEVFAHGGKTIYFAGCRECDDETQRLIAVCMDNLRSHGICDYRIRVLDTAKSGMLSPRELALRCRPAERVSTVPHTKPAVAAIIDIDTSHTGVPIAEIIIEENILPDTADEQIARITNEIMACERDAALCCPKQGHDSDLLFRMSDDFDADAEEIAENETVIAADILAESIAPSGDISPSTLCIDERFDIHLPQYPDIRIELAALPKALYILLLLHPEGLLLKDISGHRDELGNIYRLVSGRQNPSVIKRAVENIMNPSDNPLHKNLSIIRHAFLCKLRSDIAEYYIPSHGRRCNHRIPLQSNMIELPQSLRR